jgi:hypothetical protein
MLKIVQTKARKSTETVADKRESTNLQADSFYLSELLFGCWLSTGFRTPEIFGLLPYL